MIVLQQQQENLHRLTLEDYKNKLHEPVGESLFQFIKWGTTFSIIGDEPNNIYQKINNPGRAIELSTGKEVQIQPHVRCYYVPGYFVILSETQQS